ncbi:hypothetical protein QBC36DRAFT_77694 [Triangularia setosa]|uniref:Uncharacterized protein n=1 Tax=Triangularia setosa TaxID=2587417 RepID=A0AAN6WDY5_9PEZI|nr:hypothetical protein QBC36DRAFT_77694 [Podospora setosa]
MASQPTFNSNNPFRRTPVAPPADVPDQTPTFVQSPPPPPPLPNLDENETPALPTGGGGDQFWTQLQNVPRPAQPPPTTSFQKPKVIKRVRVQSPPPSSPESDGFGERFPPIGDGEDESESESDSSEEEEEVDPFGVGGSNRSSAEELGVQEKEERVGRLEGGPPRISFQMGTKQLEDEESEIGTVGGVKGGLDVDAFKRLLLTGQAGGSGPARPAVSTVNLGRVEQSAGDETARQAQEKPRLSQQISEQTLGDEQQGLISSPQPVLQPAPTILRKKPPPPSSRHGKLIRPDPTRQESTSSLGKTSSSSSLTSPKPPTPITSPSRQRPPTPSDVNKPLPSQPSVSEDSNIFDHEAAGKIPEPVLPDPGLHIIHALRSPTPPNISHSSSTLPTPPPSRKPAPPPRRQPHSRSDSKPSTPFPSDDVESGTRRSSLDSTRSRSSSLRTSVHAPAPPPPPRRPSQRLVTSPSSEAISALASQLTAMPPPLSGSSTPNNVTPTPRSAVVEAIASPPVGTPGGGLKEKLSPPPPPPARGASVRVKRPMAKGEPGGGGVVRRSSGNSSKPAPPVPKHRGSVRSPNASTTTSAVATTTDEMPTPPGNEEAGGDGVDILADLTRLQREVDELRAGLANGGSK